jgi:hypothetical protein
MQCHVQPLFCGASQVSLHCSGILQILFNLCKFTYYNYLLTYDSYVPLYNRFHRGEWITRVSGGEGALDTPGPLNGMTPGSRIRNRFLPDPGSRILDPNPIFLRTH